MKFRTWATVIAAVALVTLTLMATTQAGWWNDRDAIKGEGPIVSQERSIEPVTRVHLATQGTLFIEFGSEPKLVVDAQENLQDAIVTRVRRGELTIDSERGVSIRPTRDIEYHLTIGSLEELLLSSSGDAVVEDIEAERLLLICESSGDIKIGDITCPDLELELSSSGDMTIESWNGKTLRASLSSSGDLSIRRGAGEYQDVELSSSGDYEARAVETRTARVRVSSSGDARVSVTEELDARTSSSGDIVYSGHPEVKGRSTSSGDIVSAGS